jgi:hypothetical protein
MQVGAAQLAAPTVGPSETSLEVLIQQRVELAMKDLIRAERDRVFENARQESLNAAMTRAKDVQVARQQLVASAAMKRPTVSRTLVAHGLGSDKSLQLVVLQAELTPSGVSNLQRSCGGGG